MFTGVYNPAQQAPIGNLEAGAVALFGGESGFSSGTATFGVGTSSPSMVIIEVRAMDDNDRPKAPLRIMLNDTVIWEGESPFPDGRWDNFGILVRPSSLLTAPNSTLTITNMSPSGLVGESPYIFLRKAAVYYR